MLKLIATVYGDLTHTLPHCAVSNVKISKRCMDLPTRKQINKVLNGSTDITHTQSKRSITTNCCTYSCCSIGKDNTLVTKLFIFPTRIVAKCANYQSERVTLRHNHSFLQNRVHTFGTTYMKTKQLTLDKERGGKIQRKKTRHAHFGTLV